MKNLFENYKNQPSWKDVDKSYENLFNLGVQAIMLRGGDLLHEYFNHKSDANKYLDATQIDDLINDFREWCIQEINVSPHVEQIVQSPMEKLKESARPLIKLLNKEYHPHHVAIVTSTSIELFEGICSIPKIYDYVVD